MESLLARALEYTLKYWLKSFSRDQFKLQGRTAQLSNLDIDGDALHASLGLPPALNVSTAKVGKLEITLPSVSNVQVEPIVVQVDRLDLVLEENDDLDTSRSSSSVQSTSSSGKGSGYGFADKIADGMTLEVHTVNLLLETHGGARHRGRATWASPMASITIRNLLLYTTNEYWQVVNLKEARDFSSDKKFIYVFKKLEWEYLSIDLLPHPDMFADGHFATSQDGCNRKDDDGAKRVFFGGERFIDGISGEAHITIQRTELNSPLGLEVQLHITEAVCPALSEPGLRALLRFLTGLYICIHRGDVNPNAQQLSTEAAGCSLVCIIVDHIFLCIKDTEFQLELLMQSLLFSRACVSDGENAKYLTRVMLCGLFLRDPFSQPPCTLVQPSMQADTDSILHIPDFSKNFCPPIYPLGDERWNFNEGVPLICLYSLQSKPSPAPPSFASQTVIDCQPLMVHLQEESCLRICSFLADGIVVNPGAILPDFSVNSLVFSLKGLDITVPFDARNPAVSGKTNLQSSFAGGRFYIEDLFFSESPSLKLGLLNLEKDPACFCLWDDQPIDASLKKWKTEAALISLSLETFNTSSGIHSSGFRSSGLWRCVELRGACVEVAMATADGRPILNVPPPGGVVRVGVACEQYFSNTSVEQLFFVLDLYSYFGGVSEKMAIIKKNSQLKQIGDESVADSLIDKVPGDTAGSLAVKILQLRFVESSSLDIQGVPLVQFFGQDLFVKVAHRTLGAAVAISSSLRWENVKVDCAEAEGELSHEKSGVLTSAGNSLLPGNGYPHLRSVFWVENKRNSNINATSIPFLDIRMVQVIPYNAQDMECHSLNASACIAGVRLGGGMNYAEALLHRFGILGPDGGPGEGLSQGLERLSAGPLSKLFKTSPAVMDGLKQNGSSGDVKDSGSLFLGPPDDVDISIELKNWLFALEGVQEMAESWWFDDSEYNGREERCWHASFHCLQVKAKSNPKHVENGKPNLHQTPKHPIELVRVGVEGLQTLKPLRSYLPNGKSGKELKRMAETCDGINFEVDIVISEDDLNNGMAKWLVENLKFSVKQPIEAVVTKDELQHLALICKSEVDSMGRIAAGVLRVLKLEGSIGQAAIDQLSNLGTEGFEKIFTSKERSKGGSICSTALSPFSVNGEGLHPVSIIASLEEAILDSQAKFAVLSAELGSSESSSRHLDNIKQLNERLESVQRLLTQLRTQI